MSHRWSAATDNKRTCLRCGALWFGSVPRDRYYLWAAGGPPRATAGACPGVVTASKCECGGDHYRNGMCRRCYNRAAKAAQRERQPYQRQAPCPGRNRHEYSLRDVCIHCRAQRVVNGR